MTNDSKFRGFIGILFQIMNFFHILLFKQEIGPKTYEFIRTFFYLALGIFTASILNTLIFIFAARIIGPEEFGKYNLILSIMSFIVIPMSFGLHSAIVKYLAEGKDKEKIIGTALTILFSLSTLSIILLYSLRQPLIILFNANITLFKYSILLALAFSVYTTFEAFLKGLHAIKKVSQYRVMMTLFASMLILILLFKIKEHTFVALTYPIIAGYCIYVLFTLILLRKYLFKFDINKLKLLFVYSVFRCIGGIGGAIFNNIPKLIINYAFGFTQVGIYSAYLWASTLHITKGLDVFTILFFPTASEYSNKRDILKKVDILTKWIMLVAPLLSFVFIFIIIQLFGREYPLNWLLLIFFSLNSGLIIVQSPYTLLLNSISVRGAKYYGGLMLFVGITTAVLNFIFIPLWGLNAAALFVVMGNTMVLFLSRVFCKKLLFEQNA